MANMEQMMHVAQSCPGYEPMQSYVSNTIGAEDSKSCANCHNFHDNKCVVNLFDNVLTSLDQT